jgi:hypothetical protein
MGVCISSPAPDLIRGLTSSSELKEAPCRARGVGTVTGMVRDFGRQEEAKRRYLEGKG